MPEYRIRNWQEFQHYKFRDPPWIKLHRRLLNNPEWHELEAKCAKHLMMFWLIASENSGVLPCTRKLAFRLRTSPEDVEDTISKLSEWIEVVDSTMLSERLPDADTEKSRVEKSRVSKKYTDSFLLFWEAYPRKLGKSLAFSAWERTAKEYPHRDILKAACEYSKICEKNKTEDKYILHPSTFLNKERWKDYCFEE